MSLLPYSSAARELQDQFDTRRLADRLVQVTVHDRFTADDRAFIEARDMFFLASVAGIRGSIDRQLSGGPVRRAREGGPHLPQLPAVHPPLPARRAVSVRAEGRGADAGARVEADRVGGGCASCG
jgi:hypothetical protein